MRGWAMTVRRMSCRAHSTSLGPVSMDVSAMMTGLLVKLRTSVMVGA